MRLIDAEKLGVVTVKVPDGVDAESYVKGCQDILERIDVAPTVDAVPVVRCKDCDGKDCWYKDDNGNDICWISGMYPKGENDFCSYGERKDETQCD